MTDLSNWLPISEIAFWREFQKTYPVWSQAIWNNADKALWGTDEFNTP